MHNGFESILGANKDWGRWSDMVTVMSLGIAPHENAFETILSMEVLEWLVRLVSCRMYWMIELKARESRTLLVA